MPKFPLHEYLGVASRQNQTISTFFHDSHIIWNSVALARSDDFVHLWRLMFLPPRSEKNSSSFLFLKFGVSRNSSLKWYYGLLVFNYLRTSLLWINEKVFFLGYQAFVFLWDEFHRCSFKWWSFSYSTPGDPHQLFSHWLLIRPIVIQCAYP